MSIIEEAVRKTAERYQRPTPPEQSGGRPRLRRVPPPAADTSNVRRFQPISLDRAVLEENYILPHITDPGALRAYKILRTRMLRRLDANQWHSFAVTGATAGEGKTLTSINLAMALAQDSNTWVFLVDLDLQRPKVADYLGLTNSHGERGLTDFLLGDATFEQIVYSPSTAERLAVIPNFQAVANASDLLTSPRMDELVQALEAEKPRRIVIFDMPPVLASDDVLAFSPQVDGMLLVVAEGTTGRDALRGAKELLQEMNLLGVVLNRSEAQDEGAYYSYAR
ncbi:CpsD/CapB family tyrosine-protein kinase [Steroidobacter sp. S1-65]|uniref:CpsD/CapB family tyrosine-protein kinase n=1 Tax=Steroidobacter gossypii TaxID=2805490 RepID=A0ABS1X442_9GAMM|nr:CpsD/CapB family tyrosine-protein kinase [Steroidobacter gossypii]MBM0107993.1 CpsD/CapB family tyrosine-protein kinase [Steroidobacter gossypii]